MVSAIVLLVTLLFFVAQYTYAPFLTPYVGVLGGSLALTGLVAGSYGALQFLLRVPFGIWSDRLARRRPFVAAGALLAGLSAWGMAWAPSAWWLLAFRSLSGVAAATWVLFAVYYASLFPPDEAGKRMGYLTCAASSGQLAGNLLGGLLAERGGWTAPFLGAVVPGLLAVPFALTLPEGRPEHRNPEETTGGWRGLLTCFTPGSIEPSLIALLSHFIFYATILGFTPVYVTGLGHSKLALGVMSTAGGAAYVIGTLIATRAETRRLPWRAMVGASFAAIAAAVWLTPAARSTWQLGVVFATLGLCRGTTYPVLMAAALRQAPPFRHATTMGFFQAVYALGMFAGPAVAGVVAQRLGLLSVFSFCAALALAGLAWCGWAASGRACGGPGQESAPLNPN